MLSGSSQWLQIRPPNISRGPLSFRDMRLSWFLKFEITNPVIGCCRSTPKGCSSRFEYMRFFMSSQKFKAPEVRYTRQFFYNGLRLLQLKEDKVLVTQTCWSI